MTWGCIFKSQALTFKLLITRGGIHNPCKLVSHHQSWMEIKSHSHCYSFILLITVGRWLFLKCHLLELKQRWTVWLILWELLSVIARDRLNWILSLTNCRIRSRAAARESRNLGASPDLTSFPGRLVFPKKSKGDPGLRIKLKLLESTKCKLVSWTRILRRV